MRPVALAAVLPLLAAGCGAMDANSGGDHVRGKATAIKLNESHDDSVSADDGDHTDWKKLVLKSGGAIDFHAYWDDPSLKATIRVKDQFGGNIFELTHEQGKPEDHWRGMKLREGEYYFEVVAERGSSVYTLEVTMGDASGDEEDPSHVAPPE